MSTCEEVFKPRIFRFNQLQALANKKFINPEGTELEQFKLLNPDFARSYDYFIPKLDLTPQIRKFEDIPFSRGDRNRSINSTKLIERFYDLDTKTQSTIIEVYNTLNDPNIIREYLRKLYKDSYAWMKSNRPIEEIRNHIKNGSVNERSIAVILIQRLKARKDTNFTIIHAEDIFTGKYIKSGKQKISEETKLSEYKSFRAAVRTGPFIDRTFRDFKNHGAFSHIIQRDILHNVIKKYYGENVNEFYQFLGTKIGINFWIDLFDSNSPLYDTFTSPEVITFIIRAHLIKD